MFLCIIFFNELFNFLFVLIRKRGGGGGGGGGGIDEVIIFFHAKEKNIRKEKKATFSAVIKFFFSVYAFNKINLLATTLAEIAFSHLFIQIFILLYGWLSFLFHTCLFFLSKYYLSGIKRIPGLIRRQCTVLDLKPEPSQTILSNIY